MLHDLQCRGNEETYVAKNGNAHRTVKVRRPRVISCNTHLSKLRLRLGTDSGYHFSIAECQTNLSGVRGLTCKPAILSAKLWLDNIFRNIGEKVHDDANSGENQRATPSVDGVY